LDLLEIAQVRPVPVRNKTKEKKSDWESYYTPKMIEKAKRIYGPFMKKWGYAFPPEWGTYQIPVRKNMEFTIVNLMKKIYMVNFRYSDHRYANFVRKIHSKLRRYI